MDRLTKELIKLHGKCGLSASRWFDLLVDDVLAGFGIRLTEVPAEDVRDVLFNLSGLYAQEVINNDPFTDILGPVHMELVSQYHQKKSGQFFTPDAIGVLMAQLSMGDVAIDMDSGRLTRICDPAVGAGGLLLAALGHVLKRQGPEALEWASVTGIDIDRLCARMYPCQVLTSLYVNQLSLGELISYRGNALGDPQELGLVCHYSRQDLPSEAIAPAAAPEVKRAIGNALVSRPARGGEQLSLW